MLNMIGDLRTLYKKTVYIILLVLMAACQSETVQLHEKLAPLPSDENSSASQQIRFLNKALEKDNSPKVEAHLLYKRASIYLKAKKENIALEDLQRVLALDSSRGEYYFALAKAHYLRDENKESYYAAQKALKMGENDVELYHLYAHSAFLENSIDSSLNAFEEINQRNPNNIETLFYQGWIWKIKKDTTKAFSFLRHSLELDSTYYPAYEQIIKIYNEKGMHKTAWKKCQVALNKTDKHPKIVYQYADTWMKLKKIPDAIYWYTTALKSPEKLSQKQREAAAFTIANYYLNKKSYTKSLPYFEQVIKENPKNTSATFLIAYLYEYKLKSPADKLERLQRAKSYLKTALELKPQNARYIKANALISKKIEHEEYIRTPEYQEYLAQRRAAWQKYVRDSLRKARIRAQEDEDEF